MQRGRKIARGLTMVVLIAAGAVYFIYPDLFSAQLKMPSAEERAEAKKKRQQNQSKKPKRRLSKLDIERLAKLREQRARKHMMEILRRLEKRIIIAEKQEAQTTAKFRTDPRLFPSLQKLLSEHFNKYIVQISRERADMMVANLKGGDFDAIHTALVPMRNAERSLMDEVRGYESAASPEKLEAIIQQTKAIESLIGGGALLKLGFVPKKQTHRYLKSIAANAEAIKNQDRDLAVRGFAQPEDHPLNATQRQYFDRTIEPLSMARLHQLSQEMAAHYTNLMGDVEAGKLAEVADIPLPEALDKIAHQPYAKDDMQEQLNQDDPDDIDQLDEFTGNLDEAQRSAERALKESGGEIPGKPGESKDGKGKPGKGLFGSGGGKGTENTGKRGPPTADGQKSREKILRSLALKSQLGATQDRSRQITVDKKKVLANVLPGRRFTKDSLRKGYLFIDTWHILGPWDAASATRSREINFSKIYPPETKLNLDAIYTTGKKERVYNDERGYTGKDTLSGRLTWQFYQSPTVEVRIPREQLANDALYFAYTEVYFEQEMTMNLAIASDDAARIRVNGEIVFQDSGLSPYVISEQVRRVKFKRGVNKILVRLVNGPGPCRFSLLLTPR